VRQATQVRIGVRRGGFAGAAFVIRVVVPTSVSGSGGGHGR